MIVTNVVFDDGMAAYRYQPLRVIEKKKRDARRAIKRVSLLNSVIRKSSVRVHGQIMFGNLL